MGLIWTEGTTNFDVVAASLNTDTTIPTVSMTAPADGAIVSGTAVAVSATASDDLGVVGVQFKLDGADLGAEDTSSPYTTTWNADATTNGPHTLTAVARDAANNTTTATAVTVTVAASSGNKVTPIITWPVPASITYGTALSATQLNATTTVPARSSMRRRPRRSSPRAPGRASQSPSRRPTPSITRRRRRRSRLR